MKKSVIAGILLMILLHGFLLSIGCSDSSTGTTSTLTPVPASTKMATTSTAAPQSIAMSTDKPLYVTGEMVKLTVTNGLDVPIWYIGYPQPDLAFWEIERAQSDGWQRQYFRLPILEDGREVCRINMYERPIGAVTELKPHSDLLYEWNQKICPEKMMATGPFKPEMIERGRYRFSLRYSLDTVKSEDIESEPWKRPVELGETKIIYSNEFVLD